MPCFFAVFFRCSLLHLGGLVCCRGEVMRYFSLHMPLLRLRFLRWQFSQAVGVHVIFFFELLTAVCLPVFLF